MVKTTPDLPKMYESCNCEGAEKEREIQEQITELENENEVLSFLIRSEKQRILNLFIKSGIPERYKDYKFSDYKVGKNEESIKKITDYIKEFNGDTKMGLFLIGPPGTGKTHLVASMTRYFTLQKKIETKFIETTTLLNKLRHCFEEANEEQIETQLTELGEVPILIIDDIGKEKGSEWTNEILFRIINDRYNNCLPTIFTSNSMPNELERNLGTPIMSRIQGMTKAIKIQGKDYRGQQWMKE